MSSIWFSIFSYTRNRHRWSWTVSCSGFVFLKGEVLLLGFSLFPFKWFLPSASLHSFLLFLFKRHAHSFWAWCSISVVLFAHDSLASILLSLDPEFFCNRHSCFSLLCLLLSGIFPGLLMSLHCQNSAIAWITEYWLLLGILAWCTKAIGMFQSSHLCQQSGRFFRLWLDTHLKLSYMTHFHNAWLLLLLDRVNFILPVLRSWSSH